MKATSTGRLVGDPALEWSQRLKVEVGGTGTVAQAGVVLPRLLADRLGLTTGLADVVARAGFFRHCCIERSARPPCSTRSPRSHARGF